MSRPSTPDLFPLLAEIIPDLNSWQFQFSSDCEQNSIENIKAYLVHEKTPEDFTPEDVIEDEERPLFVEIISHTSNHHNYPNNGFLFGETASPTISPDLDDQLQYFGNCFPEATHTTLMLSPLPASPSQENYYGYYSNNQNMLPPLQYHTTYSGIQTDFTKRKPMTAMQMSPHYRRKNEKLMCTNCYTKETSLWRRNVNGDLECNACNVYETRNNKKRPPELRKDTVARRKRHRPIQ